MGARGGAGIIGATLTIAISVGLVAGCGSSAKQSSSSGLRVISAGQVDLQLPDGWTVSSDGKHAIRPGTDAAGAPSAAGASGSSGASGETSDTIPLATQDPTTKFFTAINTFQSCLKGLNVKFIGAPNPNDPATNDPNYIKNLSTCAAKSNIVQALKDQQTYQDNLTPAQIEQQNKGYLAWRDCMIGRGWGIPEPKPDEKGRLFSFSGAQNGQTPNFDPPPGQDILTSNDVRECAAETQQKFGTNSGG